MKDVIALKELLAKVEAGKYGPCTFEPLGDDAEGYALDALHGSLDAALALHNAVLPGWGWVIHGDVASVAPITSSAIMENAVECTGNPARAWLVAILKALISEAEQ